MSARTQRAQQDAQTLNALADRVLEVRVCHVRIDSTEYPPGSVGAARAATKADVYEAAGRVHELLLAAEDAQADLIAALRSHDRHR